MAGNTSNNPLFRKVRELEEKALKAGIIENCEIMASADMREEAWECYLIGRIEYLETKIKDKELES